MSAKITEWHEFEAPVKTAVENSEHAFKVAMAACLIPIEKIKEVVDMQAMLMKSHAAFHG